GAPGEDGGSGMVHVFAPWRQRLSSPFVTQLAVDCENDPVYSVKPFDEICIASTTKTMTALIACERSQLPPGDPKYVSLDQEYTVPNWIRDNVGGSLYGFRTQERMTLRDLLSACIYPSGNDAAYAIADLLTGADNDWSGYSTTCAEFVTEMNFRALQLGMTRTVFTNPAGLDIDNHHSTAWDMAILGRAAMSNPLMASIVGSTGAVIYSHWQLPDDGPFVGGSTALSYGFLQKLKARSSAFDGVKPGRTPCADVTGVFSAKSEIGRTAIASAFGYDANLPRAGYYDEAAALMNLGLEECGSPIVIHPGAYESPWGLGDLLTSEGSYMGGGSAFDDWNPDSPYALVDLFRTTGEGTTMADFEIERFSDAYFDPSEIQTFGIAPFDSHEEIVFTNQGVTNAHFLVHLSYGGDYDFNLPAGNHAIIPCVREPDSSFWFTVTNRSGGGAAIPMNLGITEPYGFELTSLPVQSGPVFRARIERPNGILSDGFRLLVAGLDPVPGRTLYASVHDEGAVVDVDSPQPQLGTGAPKATLLSVLPNPFADRVTLDFQLETAGDVALRFFDAQGREVRSIAASRIPAGRWSGVWDGRDERAQVLPRGVYFYQLSLAGHPEVSGRVHLVR
ncbi:MAG: hypothetical protein KDA27_23750, partial [Candidatus Eisenbacteria bacterium]|nr:hypothetical protein [Candidatus Eisenbacteria bacterium]